MLLLSIEIDDRIAQEYFTYAGYKVRDARDPLREIMHEVIWPAIGGQLDSEGERGGTPWDDLSDEYLERKIAEGYGGQPILRRTGKMAGRNTGDRTGALFAADSYVVTSQRLVYDPHVDYAHWHQTGGYVFGQPPQRPIVVLTVEDYEQMEAIFTEWLDDLRTRNRRRGDVSGDYRPSLPDIFIL